MEEIKNRTVYRAAIYIRLSREDKDKWESNSIKNQRDLIYAFLRDKGDIQVCTEKVDDGYSGVDFNRPAVTELLEEVKNGEINCIIVKDLSRFGRNYIETGRYIQQIFPFMGVRFIAVNDSYDSMRAEGQTDQIILPFKNLMNDSYCRDISVKVRSQIEIRQRRGDYIGSFPAFGYFRDEKQKSKLVIDEIAASTVRDIFAMRIAGQNNKSIAEYLNVRGVPSPMEYKALLHWKYTTSFKLKPQAKWSAVAVDRILKNELYTGVMVQGKERTLNYKVRKRMKVSREDWIRVGDTHAAIIPKSDFEIVQKLMLCDTRTAPKEKRLYFFSGLLRCGGCDCNMVRRKVQSAGFEYNYYICSSHKKDKTVCSSHRIREDSLSTAVLSMLQCHIALLGTRDALLHMIDTIPLQECEVQKRTEQLTQRRADLQRMQKLKISLYEDYRDALLTKEEYLEMKADYESSCADLEHAIETLEGETKALIQQSNSHNRWIETFKSLGNIAELNRSILALAIEKIIVIDAHHIKILYRYRDEFEREVEGYGAKKQEGDAAGERGRKAGGNL